MALENAKKFFRDFWIFKRRKDAHGSADEDGAEDEAMFDGNDEDENPGSTRLNEGTHRKAPGFKRGIMVFVVVAGVLIFLFAYMNRHSQKRAREDRLPQMGTTAAQEPANPDLYSSNRDNSGADSYRNYIAQLREAEAARAQSNGNRSSDRNSAPQQPPSSAMESGRRLPTLPTLPSGNYSAVPSPVMSDEERAEKEMEERYRSEIAFSLGGISGNGQNNISTLDAGAANGGDTSVFYGTQQQGGIAAGTYQAPSDHVIQAGTIIPAMLFSGINTDAPGQVIAQITTDVYDTATHSVLLIPAGSRIVGKVEASSKTKGSGRIGVTFSTLLLPDGGSYALGDSLIAADSSGYNGITGSVNRHTGRVLSGGALAAGLAALGSYASGNTSSRDTYTGGQLAMQGALANLINTTSDIFKDAANIEATVKIKPGYEFNVFVVQAISFARR